MKVSLLLIIFFSLITNLFAADSVTVNSPNKKISVTVHYKNKIAFTINYGNEIILKPSLINILLENG